MKNSRTGFYPAALAGFAAVLALALAGCQSSGTQQTTAPAAPETSAPESSAAESGEAGQEAKEPYEEKTFTSSRGWSATYNDALVDVSGEDTDTVTFTYTGEAEDENYVRISYVENMEPEAALYELTAGWTEDQEAIKRREWYFPGTEDKWGCFRSYSVREGEKSHTMSAIAGEYNGGTLLYVDISTYTGEEKADQILNKTLWQIHDSLTYENFEPQAMYSYYPGIYRSESGGDIEYVILKEDHTGILRGKEDTDINWGSWQVMGADGSFYQEFTIEGKSLYLRTGDEWQDFVKESADFYVGTWDQEDGEKLSIRIRPTEEVNWYQAEITLPGDTDGKYVARAYYQEDGSMYYDDCKYEGTGSSETGAAPGNLKSGLFYYAPLEDRLYWTDYSEAVAGEGKTFARREGDRISNGLYSILIPAGYEGVYEAETEDDAIYLYHTESKKAGFGGLIFGLRAYDDINEYAGGPFAKVGELTSGKKKEYDIVRWFESESQTGFEGEIPEDYRELYDMADDLMLTIRSEDGGEFHYGAGCLGEELYPEILKKLEKELANKADAAALEKAGFSPLYAEIADAAENIGVEYRDLNGDGVAELLIGDPADENREGMVFDIYTAENKKPAHVMSADMQNSLYISGSGLISRESAAEDGNKTCFVYSVVTNTAEPLFQVGLKTDTAADAEKPWFVTYSGGENEENANWEAVEEEDYNRRRALLTTRSHMNYMPFARALEEAGE